MIYLKNVYLRLKPYLFFLLFVISLSFLTSLLNLIGLSNKITSFFLLLIIIISFFVHGFRSGKKALKKGYIVGLKAGLSYLIVLWILDLIFFRSNFYISKLIYYLILLISAIFGSIIGINKKNKEN